MHTVASAEKVILYPNRARAVAAQKAFASQMAGSVIATRFTTPDDLISDLWDLYGDGRKIVSDIERCLIIADIAEGFGFDASLGTVCELSNFVCMCAARIDDPSSASLDERFTTREESVISLARECLRREEALGLIETALCCQTLFKVIDTLDISRSESLVLQGPYRDILVNCPIVDMGGKQHDPDDIKILMPAGPTMVSPMVAESLEKLMTSEKNTHSKLCRICLCTPDPRSLYDDLSRLIDLSDATVVIRQTIAYSQTALGRFLASVESLLESRSGGEWVQFATDAALSPYARISTFAISDIKALDGHFPPSDDGTEKRYLSARNLNTLWRRDRTFSAEDAILLLSQISSNIKGVMEILDSGHASSHDCASNDYGALLQALESCAATSFDSFDCERELAAMSKLRDTLEASRNLGVMSSAVLKVLSGSSVSVCVQSADTSSISLEFISLDSTDQLAQSSFDAVYLCDVTDVYLNSRDAAGALARLMSALGAERQRAKIDKVNALFSSAVGAARKSLVFVFPLIDGSAKETYASFAFDNYLEERFGAGVDAASIAANRKPKDFEQSSWEAIRAAVSRRGEEDVEVGLGMRLDDPSDVKYQLRARRGELDDAACRVLLSHVGGFPDAPVVLSPSSIEAYMACPYKWFVERKLGVSGIDESFGAAERGSFVHSVLERFYSRVISMGGRAVFDNMSDDRLRDLLFEVFDTTLRIQTELEPGSGRYIPINQTELVEVERLRDAVFGSILLWRNLPRFYEPVNFEMRIDPEADGGPIVYGGAAIKGIIDRTDADGEGHFYILDYKGSLKGHDAGLSQFQRIGERGGCDGEECVDGKHLLLDPHVYPDHIQTLIYASVEQKRKYAGGGSAECIGALYTSYMSKSASDLVVGSYAAGNTELAMISDRGSVVDVSFEEFLDAVEVLVSKHIGSLKEGRIAIDPKGETSCAYCVYEGCEGRLK